MKFIDKLGKISKPGSLLQEHKDNREKVISCSLWSFFHCTYRRRSLKSKNSLRRGKPKAR